MKRIFLSFVFTIVALLGLFSCANNSRDKEIIDFFTEGFTEMALEPFSFTSRHYFVIEYDERFDDWDKELQAINANVISKFTDYGKKTILTTGKPYTEKILYRVDLIHEKNIDKIVKKIIVATNKKTGIEFSKGADGYRGSNQYMSISINSKKNIIVLDVVNLLTNNSAFEDLY